MRARLAVASVCGGLALANDVKLSVELELAQA